MWLGAWLAAKLYWVQRILQSSRNQVQDPLPQVEGPLLRSFLLCLPVPRGHHSQRGITCGPPTTTLGKALIYVVG